MKNFYCSFLNSPEAFVLGNRLIYQDQPGKKLLEAEPAKGAKKEGSGLWKIAERGQKETQKKLDRLDFLALKARVEEFSEENVKLIKEKDRMEEKGLEISKDFVKRREINDEKRKAVLGELNDKYGINIDVDMPFGLRVGGENIVVTEFNFEYGGFSKALEYTRTTEIRPDGTFVRLKEKTDGQSVTFDSRTGKTIYTLPKGKKAPDEF